MRYGIFSLVGLGVFGLLASSLARAGTCEPAVPVYSDAQLIAHGEMLEASLEQLQRTFPTGLLVHNRLLFRRARFYQVCSFRGDRTDSDRDGLPDCFEKAVVALAGISLSHSACDSDGDLLPDGGELFGPILTDPRDRDSDKDGLDDFVEQSRVPPDLLALVCPRAAETVEQGSSTACDTDTDGDGLTDAHENRTFGLDPDKPDMPVRTEYIERDTLSLVRAGVPTHRFRLHALDIPAFTLGLGLSRGLRPSVDPPDRGGKWVTWEDDADEILLGAIQVIPTIMPLETGRGTTLRDLGRSIVRAEATMLAQGAGYGLASLTTCREDGESDPECTRLYGRNAGAAGSLMAWSTVLLKSRRQRGLAFDVESIVLVGATAILSPIAICAIDQELAESPGELGQCIGATATGSAVGFLVPFLHIGGEL